MKEKIGTTAGKVWETLKASGETDISELPRKMKEKAVIVQQALGWLAREDKIEYHVKGRKVLVCLTEQEQNMN